MAWSKPPDAHGPHSPPELDPKRLLTVREFALGVESVERLVSHEPLRWTSECILGVLAMESEPVDPRL